MTFAALPKVRSVIPRARRVALICSHQWRWRRSTLVLWRTTELVQRPVAQTRGPAMPAPKAGMYLMFRGENPFISGRSARRSRASRSTTRAPHPRASCLCRTSPPMCQVEEHELLVRRESRLGPCRSDADLQRVEKSDVLGRQWVIGPAGRGARCPGGRAVVPVWFLDRTRSVSSRAQWSWLCPHLSERHPGCG